MISVWQDKFEPRHFGRQNGDINTEVLIIGGGLAGILTAYMLEQERIKYILVEASTLCSGITKNTTAKITSQHGLIYSRIARQSGLEYSQLYLRANQAALERFKAMCRNIDCDFEQKDSYVYSLNDLKKLNEEASTLKKWGFDAPISTRSALPFPVAGTIRFPAQAQFNPLKFTNAIVPELKIYENTPVRELADHTAITDYGKIRADKIIVATHFPFINKHGSYFLKMYQHRSYVIALENAQELGGMYVDRAQNGMSFRNYGNLLLIGGGSHRTGKKGGNWQELREFAQRYYPNAKEKYHWATQDCMTLDGVPYIGKYSRNTPDFYVATGFNKWGMTSSMVSAMLLRDLIKRRKNPFEALFSPSRTILRPQLAVNACESVTNLLTPSAKRCPHMGCVLKWNNAEHTWDCPCHGSRFTEKGSLIDNPATGDLK